MDAGNGKLALCIEEQGRFWKTETLVTPDAVDGERPLDALAGKAIAGERFVALGPDDVKMQEVKEGSVVQDYLDVKIAGYASTWAEVTPSDRQGDAVKKGAFKDTIPAFMRNPVMLLNHRNEVGSIAGRYTRIIEDAKGLYIEGAVSGSPDMRHARFLIAEGTLRTLSIGGIWFYGEDGRTIEKAHLFEISLVAVPANPDAIIQARGLDLLSMQ